jgi:hypothetical protein
MSFFPKMKDRKAKEVWSGVWYPWEGVDIKEE